MGCSQSQSQSQCQSQPQFRAQYCLREKIQSGAFGCVYKARLLSSSHPEDDAFYAVKVTDKKARNLPQGVNIKKDFQREVKMMKLVSSSDAVVQLIDAFEDGHFCYVVMELCQASVHLGIDASRLQENDTLRILLGMLQGIAHCHSLRVIHRDIKPHNFLISGSTNLSQKGWKVKLGDFGLAAHIPVKRKGLTWVCGTGPFMAPEMLQEEKPYDFKVDIWSLGVTAYLMLFDSLPYSNYQQTKEGKVRIRYRVKQGMQMPSHDTIDFVRSLLDRQPLTRPTATQALDMPIIKNCPGDESLILSRENSVFSDLSVAMEQASEIEKFRPIPPESLVRFDQDLKRPPEKLPTLLSEPVGSDGTNSCLKQASTSSGAACSDSSLSTIATIDHPENSEKRHSCEAILLHL